MKKQARKKRRKNVLLMKELLQLGKLYAMPVLEKKTLLAYVRRQRRVDVYRPTFTALCAVYEKHGLGRENKPERIKAVLFCTKDGGKTIFKWLRFLKKAAKPFLDESM